MGSLLGNPRNQHHRVQVTLTPVRVSGRLHGSCFPVSPACLSGLFVRLSGSLGSDLNYPLTFSHRDPLGTKRLRAVLATKRRSDAPAVAASLQGDND